MVLKALIINEAKSAGRSPCAFCVLTVGKVLTKKRFWDILISYLAAT